MEIKIVLIIIADDYNAMCSYSAEHLGSLSSERLSNWSKVTQLISDSLDLNLDLSHSGAT